MGDKSNIEWTDATWNPVRGCSRVSAGCMNCYAERVAARFSKPGLPYAGLVHTTTQGPKWTGKVSLHPELLDQPLRWRKPRRIFVNSMSDLFHDDVPDEFILQVFDVMRECQNGYTRKIGGDRGQLVARHTFQILTKRPKRMLDFCTRLRFAQNDASGLYLATPLPHNGFNPMTALKNVWLGVSVEEQATADERIPLLLQTPAAVRFVSAEPLLGAVDLRLARLSEWNVLAEKYEQPHAKTSIDWVITGGESGLEARPAHPDWFRSLRDQCAAAKVPFFFKQWGMFGPERRADLTDPPFARHEPLYAIKPDGANLHHSLVYCPSVVPFPEGMWWLRRFNRKGDAGRLLDGREWNDFPA